MRRTVQLNNSATADKVGCSESYFNAHLRDHNLEVVTQTQTQFEVKDANDTQWTISRELIAPAQYKTVGEELTQGREAV